MGLLDSVKFNLRRVYSLKNINKFTILKYQFLYLNCFIQQSILHQKSDVRAGNNVTPELTAFRNTYNDNTLLSISADKNIKSGISHRKS